MEEPLTYPMRHALSALRAHPEARRGVAVEWLGGVHAVGTWRALERRGLVELEACSVWPAGKLPPRWDLRARLPA